jgi:hypothetical protein
MAYLGSLTAVFYQIRWLRFAQGPQDPAKASCAEESFGKRAFGVVFAFASVGGMRLVGRVW